jgi:dTDP-4-dehydrorhamnose 3,5-epimerase
MSVIHIAPRRFGDSRGWFSETWNQERFEALAGPVAFCQDNHSLSAQKGTLRGLHFQHPPFAQAKLVRCIRGKVFDVAVDIRRESPTYRHWIAVELSADAGNQLFIPAGYAHGFLTLEDDCEVVYKVDAHYAPAADGGIIWNDPDIGIEWPDLGCEFLLSDKDSALPQLAHANFDFDYNGKPLNPVTPEGALL